MKIAIVIVSILLILFIVFQFYTTMATKKSETQPYKVIRTEKEFEIRFYPSVTFAMITSPAKTYKELGNSGFRKLAGYIFGGNNENKQIPMTSPVHMNIRDTLSSMSFVMPADYNMNNLPIPNNSEVSIRNAPDEYVAAISFGGFASGENIKKHITILESALKDYQLSYYGDFRYLGYNPPYQLFGRRNEVIVAIDKNQINNLNK
jgi:hypothetical protein